MLNPIYNGVIIMSTILYTLILFNIDEDGAIDLVEYGIWIEVPALILTLFYLVDVVANFVVLGAKRVW